MGGLYLGDPRQRDLVLEKVVGSGAQLLNLVPREPMRPLLRGIAILLGLPDGRTGDVLGELVKGTQFVVERGVLAGGFEAVGEDVDGDGGLREGHVEEKILVSK
jgi:hypothetical protein